VFTATSMQWLLIESGREPFATQSQVHLFTVLSWALLSLNGLVGLIVLHRRWRRASAIDAAAPVPGGLPVTPA
jgi:hypothetical protein